ncbi:hypothetical protein AVEN_66628-1 [Araneus ventricosus]|uniref:Uncharacterized protein n=1 Tax=Araneus ventricosus TaxID=182803 RepID=A0A4Y2NHE1_ARAVE|nr:hypothetical protein AVEN_66628-1 [Araneus ventricosus]
MTWEHPSSSVTKKFKVSHSAGKVVLAVFWDAKGVILMDFFTSGTINGARYCDPLSKLMSAIRRKRRELLSVTFEMRRPAGWWNDSSTVGGRLPMFNIPLS